jgi:putative sigma-54 modulation protein
MPPVSWSHSVVAEVADEIPHDVVAEGSEATAPGPKPMVVKTERLQANPMSVEEAIMQLNLLHKQFLVFCHSETGAINVVYRREDDGYGLIETTPQSPAEIASPA